MFDEAALIDVLARLILATKLHMQHGEDTIGVLLKCGAFRSAPSFDGSDGSWDGWVVLLADQIDARIAFLREHEGA